MVASSLLDLTSAEGRESIAVELVRSALAEIEQIDRVDQMLMHSADGDQLNRPMAETIRTMYESWCSQTEALEQRIGAFEQSKVAGAAQLARAYGRTRAMLSISLEDLEESLKDIAEGRTIPLEEVRRELRHRHH